MIRYNRHHTSSSEDESTHHNSKHSRKKLDHKSKRRHKEKKDKKRKRSRLSSSREHSRHKSDEDKHSGNEKRKRKTDVGRSKDIADNINSSDSHYKDKSRDKYLNEKIDNKYDLDENPSRHDKGYHSPDSSDDSEQEIMFDWVNYKSELNILFFQDRDFIKRGTEEYSDFWKFLKKYQAVQKQKTLKNLVSKSQMKGKVKSSSSESVLGLPAKFNNRYFISFAIRGESISSLQNRLPPRDFDDDSQNRLSKKRIEEFKSIILLYLNFNQKKNFEKLKKLRSFQNDLPIAQYKENIVNTLKDNSIVLIAGDTGCGKSTQVPQYLMHAGYSNIACTQPRRIACISLSKRVAHETLNEYGSQVGYQIRFEKRKTDHTRILFLTEGLLLRQVSTDSTLSMYDVIILDEIHERHLHTDFLLGVIKCLLLHRKDIKIICMSATINIELFSNYFLGKAPVIQVPGRLYPIKLQYFPIPVLEETTKSDKLNPAPFIRILQLIDNKYKEDDRGDVLMFLSGFSEINTVTEAAKLYSQQSKKWVILPLHSNMSVSDQEKVFDVPPEGIRKCIVSTNIAETSVTIDGVRFVVDSGKVKEMSYDSACKMQKLKEFWVSQASAEQRKGRAGRTGPGQCFRLYSKEQFESFEPYTTPEIQRVPLDSLVLQMIAMGLPDVRLFPFIQPPPKESLELSVKSLKTQAAITDIESLTTTGRLLSQLPVDVSIGKMLLMGSLFHQAETTLSLSAALSVQCVFTSRAQRDPDCINAMQELLSSHGDPFTLINAYRGWLSEKNSDSERFNSNKWCRKRGLEEQRFYEMTKLRHQFAMLLKQSKLHESPVVNNNQNSASERAKRHGELQQLRAIQKTNEKSGSRKAKVLKVDHEGNALSDGEGDTGYDPKHLDFSIKNDSRQINMLLKNSDVRSFRDLIMLKIVLSSGLYPNIAIADAHNNYKAGSEQMFHTPNKPFAILHPTSVLAKQPEVLEITDADIVDLPEFSRSNPLSSKHQILLYVSLLETNKAFLMNTFRVPTAQTALMFSQDIDTNCDMTTIVCDNFIELRFPDENTAQDLVVTAVQMRKLWNELLELKLELSVEGSSRDELEVLTKSSKLERQLSTGLIELYMREPVHSQRRLLAADVQILHKGPYANDVILDANPFSGESCLPNQTKGGVRLTSYLTYNSLLDTECQVTTFSEMDYVCPFCEASLRCRVLGKLHHMVNCEGVKRKELTTKGSEVRDPNDKEFYCPLCDKTLWLSIKQIFEHRRKHSE